ncbi:L,D-transpeptidase [Solirubrobacter sp. CPCC 204708]|uniref:L,D-transpeptidase n=1 Tax=Solirubrobacter deserti TaxID=2282478 RepID=A0ABT4RQM2_9ACTN|nr:L,D-transpeptidase [Solirubrobacter deserti]MBE2320538.1 L,D-transpeptidase [Solirubrobacter deserti]MDA0140834.1 L,D-transpeptidase [Solirubrobacter deserti]
MTVTYSSGLGRGKLALLGLTLITATGAGTTPARAAVPAEQPLVVLSGPHVARTAPRASANTVETVSARRPLTRVRTVLPVIGPARRGWVRVMLPGRPNGHKAWIRTYRTEPTSTPWHLHVDLSQRSVTAYRNGARQRRFRAIIGAPATPTPRGRSFIEETMRLSATAAGGPYALATSARSDVLQEFAGGPGQIALHGTNHLTGTLSSNVSHGCVRLSDTAIRWLAERIGPGVPVTTTN